jgi:hypothetical protein
MQTARVDQRARGEQERGRWHRNGALLGEYPKKNQCVTVPFDKVENADDLDMLRQPSPPRRGLRQHPADLFSLSGQEEVRFGGVRKRTGVRS